MAFPPVSIRVVLVLTMAISAIAGLAATIEDPYNVARKDVRAHTQPVHSAPLSNAACTRCRRMTGTLYRLLSCALRPPTPISPVECVWQAAAPRPSLTHSVVPLVVPIERGIVPDGTPGACASPAAVQASQCLFDHFVSVSAAIVEPTLTLRLRHVNVLPAENRTLVRDVESSNDDDECLPGRSIKP